MSESSPEPSRPSIAWGLLGIVAFLAVVGYLGGQKYASNLKANANEELVNKTLRGILSSEAAPDKLAEAYQDADGDLVADEPTDAGELFDPETIKFTYIANTSQTGEEAAAPWKELVAALAERLGKPVEYVVYTDTGEQLRALREGELHISGFSTGAALAGVNESGFIPVCTFGREDGTYGYKMKMIVAADSKIKETADLGGKRVAFTRPRSNSGYKAPLVLLLEEHNWLPERDYRWGFTYGHEQSIQRVANKEVDVAAVASDLLDGMQGRGEVAPDAIRAIYESELFPPAAVGYAHNLKPELKEAIQEVLLGFDWSGTGLEAEWGPSGAVGFVEINYKDDWSNVRRIASAVAKARAEVDAASN
ncbi:MAG: phosphate/phosphite/phosphonate ABC transporter substrate-binding protein [Planctomycetota bacterium]